MMFQTRKTVQTAILVGSMESEKGLETIAGLERTRRATMKVNDASGEA